MRERSTWNRQEVMSKAAALKKVADPYTMNQDHPQPSADKYVTGDPSTFAEDVHSPNSWDVEYSGEEVNRNEIGMPEFRPETWSHAEKTAHETTLIKKANLCIAVAKLILNGKKAASEAVIEDQALELMSLSDSALLATAQRLAGDDDEEEEEEGQEKQAADDEESGDSEEEDQEKQASDDDEEEEEEGQEKQAADDEEEEEEGEEDQEKQASSKTATVEQIAQAIQSSLAGQIQQMVQQAMQQVMPGMQMQQGQQQDQMVADQMQQDQMQDEQALDQMLAGQDLGPMAEADIQMDPAPMDDMDYMASEEDQILNSLFASDDGEEEEDQEKQARTASTRTVGTRPTTGVAKLGGGTSKVASDKGVDQLSSLWNSAPDVRDYFGTK